ncbi:hypothetical protein [Streptomyces sp. SID12501]|uniref:hypothetical protein n=1 Tax=Streptomyces sp. SID12501 TaxID=2706042 RepID=UPI001EF30B86|nr:hypothetical protein [Streptomyces sp. SID12501]
MTRLGPLSGGEERELHPVLAYDAFERDGLAEGKVGGGGVLVPLDQLQRVHDGLVLVVGGAEVEHAEELHQPAAVVVGVGGLEHLPLGAGELGVRRLHLRNEVLQRLLSAGRREDHGADRAVGGAERGGGDLSEESGLAADLGELGDERLGHLLLRPRVDAVHGGVQQLHEGVGDLPLTLEQQRGEQDVPHLGGEAAQVARGGG